MHINNIFRQSTSIMKIHYTVGKMKKKNTIKVESPIVKLLDT